MVAFRFKHVCIESYAINTPPQELTTAALEDMVASVYERLGIPMGTLERLTGVANRYLWDKKERPSAVATVAAQKAIEQCGIDRKELRAVLSCSVVRDYFEPATGTLIHRNLGLDENSIALDVSNACLGFSNGIFFLSNLIESGIVKAGIVVSGENVRPIVDSTIWQVLNNKDLSRDQLLRILPSFTLGSGAVAYVLCHESIATKKHRILGGVTRSATQFNDLCNGNADYYLVDNPSLDDPSLSPVMETESSKLIASAALLGGRTWAEASEVLGWSKDDIDHVFCHQVGRQVNEAFYNTMGLDFSKEFSIYKQYGNLVSAALPTALALGVEARNIKKGDKVVLTGFGSGLNALFMGIEW